MAETRATDDEWEPVCLANELTTEYPHQVTLASGDEVAVVLLGDGTLRAIGNVCPHKDAPLSTGDIEDVAGEWFGYWHGKPGPAAPDGAATTCVKCPRHRRKFCSDGLYFSVESGRSVILGERSEHHTEAWAVPTYGVDARAGGKVYVTCRPVTKPVAPYKQKSKAKQKKGKGAGDAGRRGDSSEGGGASSGTAAGPALSADRSGARTGAGTGAGSAGAARPVSRADHSVDAHTGWHAWKVAAIERHNHDTNSYTFERTDDGSGTRALSVAPGVSRHSWHVAVQIRGSRDSRPITRDYTPVSSLDEWDRGMGRIVIVIKIYPKGKFTQRLARVHVGDVVDISCPEATLRVPSLRHVDLDTAHVTDTTDEGDGDGTEAAGGGADALSDSKRQIGLIAGGTGIAPMLQLVRGVLTRPDDFDPSGAGVAVKMLYSNHTAEDILLREEVDALSRDSDGAFRMMHTLTRDAPADWSGCVGRIDASMVEWLPAPGPRTTIVVCGPTGLWESASRLLRERGFANDEATGHVVELEA